MLNRFIRINGQEFSFDAVAKALGVDLPEGIDTHQVQLCQRVNDGVLVAGGAWSETDDYPGIDIELQLPQEKETSPVLLTRTEQPLPESEPGALRTYCYSREEEYFMYFDADTRPDQEVDKLFFPPAVTVSGVKGYPVEVWCENPHVEFESYKPPKPSRIPSYPEDIQRMANIIYTFQETRDTYELQDQSEDREEDIELICNRLSTGRTDIMEAYFQDFMEESNDPEAVREATDILNVLQTHFRGHPYRSENTPAPKPSLASQIESAASRSAATVPERDTAPER